MPYLRVGAYHESIIVGTRSPTALVEILRRTGFTEPTGIVTDRGQEAHNLMAHLLEKPNMDFLLRVKQNCFAMRETTKLPIKQPPARCCSAA